MTAIKAGVVVVNRFCRPGDKVFSAYINYIEGTKEERQKHLSQYNLYNDYMGDDEKATGLFTSGNTNLSKKEKAELKDIFKLAQDNGSLMWQTVISFDNRWLEQNGLYDSKTGVLDEKRIKQYATDSISIMLKNEGLENAVWSAGIHYNTDNLHVHVAIVEPVPYREMKAVRQYKYTLDGNGDYIKTSNGEIVRANGRNEINKWGVPFPRYTRTQLYDEKGKPVTQMEYNGRFKGKSIELCKKQMVDSILDQKENNILLNSIIRERIVKNKYEHPLAKDEELRQMFMQLYTHLPHDVNRSLWNYNNNIMQNLKTEIDELTEHYLNKYSAEDYAEFKSILKKQSEGYRTAYGNTRRSFEENKQRELYERMGNAILKELREFDKKISQIENTDKKTVSEKSREVDVADKIQRLKKQLGKIWNYEIERALIKLKHSLKNTKEKFFNEFEYNKLQNKEHQEER